LLVTTKKMLVVVPVVGLAGWVLSRQQRGRWVQEVIRSTRAAETRFHKGTRKTTKGAQKTPKTHRSSSSLEHTHKVK
jgi:hypothetical protein